LKVFVSLGSLFKSWITIFTISSIANSIDLFFFLKATLKPTPPSWSKAKGVGELAAPPSFWSSYAAL
jgi:hypothetical protein